VRLVITTPTDKVVDERDVVHVRGRDDSGAFGIARGHVDFVTALDVSIVHWRIADGTERVAAVRGGVLRVTRGDHIEIASREVVAGASLTELETSVLERLYREEAAEGEARAAQRRLEANAVRLLYHHLHPELVARLSTLPEDH